MVTVSRTQEGEVGDDVVLDLDGDDRIVGFEVSGLSRKRGRNTNLSKPEIREPSGKKAG